MRTNTLHSNIKEHFLRENNFGKPKEKWQGDTVFTFLQISLFCWVAAAKSLQSSPTLWDPIDSGLSGSAVPGILQARTLEWVANSFSNAWKWKVKVKSLSRVRLFVTPWSVAYQAPLSMGFSRQESWSGLPFPSPLLSRSQVKYSEGAPVGGVLCL